MNSECCKTLAFVSVTTSVSHDLLFFLFFFLNVKMNISSYRCYNTFLLILTIQEARIMVPLHSNIIPLYSICSLECPIPFYPLPWPCWSSKVPPPPRSPIPKKHTHTESPTTEAQAGAGDPLSQERRLSPCWSHEISPTGPRTHKNSFFFAVVAGVCC